MSTIKYGAIAALICCQTSAITLEHKHQQSINNQAHGIFGKMIEMATAGEKD